MAMFCGRRGKKAVSWRELVEESYEMSKLEAVNKLRIRVWQMESMLGQ